MGNKRREERNPEGASFRGRRAVAQGRRKRTCRKLRSSGREKGVQPQEESDFYPEDGI